jgi:flagella basal body P-ring formation protein FlgA
MNSSGSLLMLGLAASTLSAQTPAPASPVSEGLSRRVAEAVARMWDVEAAGIRLEWGRLPAGIVLGDDAAFRFQGHGDGGWFVVLFTTPRSDIVAARVRAGIADSVPVAARPLGAGTRLSEADVAFHPAMRWGAPLEAVGRYPRLGWVARRSIAVGEALEPPLVSPPPMVEAGRPIRVTWSGGAVTVAIEGVALNAAGLGESVRVRTLSRTGMVRGTVTGPGEARMEQ